MHQGRMILEKIPVGLFLISFFFSDLEGENAGILPIRFSCAAARGIIDVQGGENY